jgi:hypothetical protein
LFKKRRGSLLGEARVAACCRELGVERGDSIPKASRPPDPNAGAVVGTRFCVAEESLMHPLAKQRLISAAGSETVRTHVFDEVRGIEWSKRYRGRALRTHSVDRWHDRDEGLDKDLAERERYLPRQSRVIAIPP